MKAGWKNRIQERIYFEQKQKEKYDTLMERIRFQHEINALEIKSERSIEALRKDNFVIQQ